MMIDYAHFQQYNNFVSQLNEVNMLRLKWLEIFKQGDGAVTALWWRLQFLKTKLFATILEKTDSLERGIKIVDAILFELVGTNSLQSVIICHMVIEREISMIFTKHSDLKEWT
ncbi:hypothetical protein PPL_01597 [Heterostelium album PN500]|uniref:Uncharacterized protein n=1 Tax=Heterostelium pallidum (strain ATCC 26659 / Pp 5 / PN500) TaxID=670386 RepID=D3AZY3_HETP5|nr:hypothetical protein PPL_01597 [Heterostelium album PN500]EFA84607.1 hypothetical protein PPL_01597 [Heterostelium album PN500]|eukprot:XP_020436720.1 hypothetical protein PPL_01597 [Heterostelium album PN500]